MRNRIFVNVWEGGGVYMNKHRIVDIIMLATTTLNSPIRKGMKM